MSQIMVWTAPTLTCEPSKALRPTGIRFRPQNSSQEPSSIEHDRGLEDDGHHFLDRRSGLDQLEPTAHHEDGHSPNGRRSQPSGDAGLVVFVGFGGYCWTRSTTGMMAGG